MYRVLAYRESLLGWILMAALVIEAKLAAPAILGKLDTPFSGRLSER
jgi:hypothetical protein